MSSHKSFVEANATIAQYRLYQADTADMKRKLDETLANEHEKKLRAVKEWLAVGSQPQIKHEEHRGTRKEYSSTAQWVLRHGAIKHWRDSDVPKSPMLWMHGIPGAGKILC